MKVAYHKFTGSMPIVFVENFSDFADGIGTNLDELEQSSAVDGTQEFCKFLNFKGSPLKFVVFSEGMMRTIFGEGRVDPIVDASLAVFSGKKKYPMNEKLALTHAIKLAVKHERRPAFDMLVKEYESKFNETCPYRMEEALEESILKEAPQQDLDDITKSNDPKQGFTHVSGGQGNLYVKGEMEPKVAQRKAAKSGADAKFVDGRMVPLSAKEKNASIKGGRDTQKPSRKRKVKVVDKPKDDSVDARVDIDKAREKAIDRAISSLQSSKSNKDEIGKIISALQSLKETGKISGDMVELISTIVRPVESGKKSYVIKGDATGNPLKDFESYDKINGSSFASLLSDIGVPYVETAKTIVGNSKMKPERTFVDESGEPIVREVSGKKIKNGVEFNGQKITRKKVPDTKKLIAHFEKQGLSSDEAEHQAKMIQRSIEKYNSGIDRMAEKIESGKGDLSILEPIPGVNPDTPKNREKLANVAIDSIIDRLNTLTEGKDKEKIIETINRLKASNADNITEAIESLNELANDDILRYGTADIVEMFSYIEALKRGYSAYLPAEGNFPLGDIVVLPDPDKKLNSIPDIVAAMDFISVSFDSRSIKKDAGGASAAKEKIEQSTFDPPKTKKVLQEIDGELYDQIWESGDPDAAEKRLRIIAKAYGINVDELLGEGKKQIESVIRLVADPKKNPSFKGDPELYAKQVKAEYIMGMLTQKIYNDHVISQGFSNHQYKVGSNRLKIDKANGVTRLAYMKYRFNNKWSKSSGKPDTRLAGGMANGDARR